MKKILLINPPSKDRTINRDMAGGLGYSGGEGVVLPPLELTYLAGRLKETGYEVKIVDALAKNYSTSVALEQINKYNPDWVVGNLALPTLEEDIEFYSQVKKSWKVAIKTGINYKEILTDVVKKTKADMVVFQEVDDRIEQYLFGQNRAGTVILKEGKVKFSPADKVIEDLDKLPFPLRELLDKKDYSYSLLRGHVASLQTSRGCPFACGFYCPYPLVQGKMWRKMSPKRVLEEMKSIEKLGYDSVLFRDATFTIDKNRTLEICRLFIKNKLKLKWWCETRINVLDSEILQNLKDAGCLGINVGIETLDDELIKTQGKPGVDMERVVEIRDKARQIGIKLHFLMLVGLMDESWKTIGSSLKWLVKLNPESVGFSVITPYPGTQMFEVGVKEKLIKKFDWNNYRGNVGNMKSRKMEMWELETARVVLMVSAMLMKKSGLVNSMTLKAVQVGVNVMAKIRN